MTPESFKKWLKEMQAKGLASSDAECGRLLGVGAHSIVNMKRRGADTRTALACAALLNGVEGYQ